jgi:hypothetical protein
MVSYKYVEGFSIWKFVSILCIHFHLLLPGADAKNTTIYSLKPGFHYQSFCDHSRNFAKVNSTFWRICKKYLREISVKQWVSSIKHFLQILQNLEFTYTKFPLWSQKLWYSTPGLIIRTFVVFFIVYSVIATFHWIE